MPGFGIVAAVLGIVVTMASISGPVEQIGTDVAAALVGTFLGILLCLRLYEPAGDEPGIHRRGGTGLHPLHRLLRHRFCQRHGAGHGGGIGPARLEQRIPAHVPTKWRQMFKSLKTGQITQSLMAKKDMRITAAHGKSLTRISSRR